MRTGFIFTRKDGLVFDLIENGGYMSYKPELQNSLRNVESIGVLGRDSSVTFDYGNYKNRDITIPIFHYNYDTINNLNLAFNGIGGKLKFNYKEGYYKVKTVDNIYTRDAKGVPETDIFLTLEPFMYLDKVKETLNFTTSDRVKTFDNLSGNMNSKAKITVYGSGNINVVVNDIEFVLTGVSTKITLDSTMLQCYKDTENCNSKVNGSLDKLIVKNGTNTINAKLGTVSKVEIEYEPIIFE